jgi:hypothetical protein
VGLEAKLKSGKKHVGAIGELISDAGSIPAASTISRPAQRA